MPGDEPNFSDEYAHHLRLIPWLRPFEAEVAALNLAQPGFVIEIEDPDNPDLPPPKKFE